MLFALLATLAPAFSAPLPGTEFQDYVSAPADPQGDAATLVSATPCIAEDLEDDSDEEGADKAAFLGFATLDCARCAEYRAADAWLPSFRRPSTHFSTGPPTL